MIQISAPFTGPEELEAVRGPLESGWLTQGPEVAEFERRFAERHQVAAALATTSCTTALHLALVALGIGPGDEVVVPGFTWIASANAVRYCGATPVFIDVDPSTYNLDPTLLTSVITPRTRAVMAVHLFGLCADVNAIRAALPEDVAIVEDAACAVGASYHGRPAGSLGAVAAFSFHPRKIITTGEGGMLTTDDTALAQRVEILRNHGASVSEEQRHHGPSPWRLPSFDVLGFNYRMTDLQGAVGVVQMGRLEGLLTQRRAGAQRYHDELADLAWLTLPCVPDGYEHSWQAYVVVVHDDAPLSRNDLMAELHRRGVSTRPGTHAASESDLYRDPGGHVCPQAWRLEQSTMAIPLHNQMTDADFSYVVECLRGL